VDETRGRLAQADADAIASEILRAAPRRARKPAAWRGIHGSLVAAICGVSRSVSSCAGAVAEGVRTLQTGSGSPATGSEDSGCCFARANRTHALSSPGRTSARRRESGTRASRAGPGRPIGCTQRTAAACLEASVADAGAPDGRNGHRSCEVDGWAWLCLPTPAEPSAPSRSAHSWEVSLQGRGRSMS
jgi:hypothetical protein